MKFDAFFGGSYQSQAVTADQERTINFYPEVLQSPGATSRMVLYPTPGVQNINISGQLGAGFGRGHYALNNQEFAVLGNILYEIESSGFMNSRATVAVDDNPATICGNGEGQFLVTSGGNAYIYDNATMGCTQISGLDGKARMGGYLDGRFLVLDNAASPPTLYISAVFDGLTWTPGTDFAQRTLAPDPWRSFKVVGRYIWLFGELTTEIWQDVGANFPFAPFPSSLIPYGIAAPFSAALVGDGVAWLAVNAAGKRCVMYAAGQNPESISTYPLESALGEYNSVASAVGDSYSDRGHTFYLLSVEDEPETTYVWDLETKLWHERATWRYELNKYEAWRPRFHAYAFGEHRILDSAGSYLYKMHPEITTDVDSLPIRRMRRAPAIQNEDKRIFYPRLQLDVEPGLGLGDDTPNRPRPSMVSFEMRRTTGRLLAIDDGDWASNISGAYNYYQADHDRLLSDIVFFLTGKRSGANILICEQHTTDIWGTQFQAGLTRLGHTFSQTLTHQTLNGYVMGDFDMTIMYTLSGGDYLLIDPYLDAGGAILTVLGVTGDTTWARYGFKVTTAFPWWQSPILAHPYLNPMICPTLGGSPYNKFILTSPMYVAVAPTILTGTTTLFTNENGEYMAALWEKN